MALRGKRQCKPCQCEPSTARHACSCCCWHTLCLCCACHRIPPLQQLLPLPPTLSRSIRYQPIGAHARHAPCVGCYACQTSRSLSIPGSLVRPHQKLHSRRRAKALAICSIHIASPHAWAGIPPGHHETAWANQPSIYHELGPPRFTMMHQVRYVQTR